MVSFTKYDDHTVSLYVVELILSQEGEFTEDKILRKLRKEVRGKRDDSKIPLTAFVKSALQVLQNRAKVIKTPFAYQVVR